jgi:hypothetical protein
LIHIDAAQDGGSIGEQLQRDGESEWQQFLM